ncbi:coagulation factor X-like [Mercenaria mercenaria]|uniref:coagulation factor X-like n=1 Tax=Mercenaria mercenaria TaxID=6596 RepID=UPI00234ED1E5|nr:coagulation factor X-like [Mercenaria mercenaria]
MQGLYFLCFVILVKLCLAHVIVPGVLETVSPNLRTKRENLNDGENSSAILPLFELKTDVSFADGGFKAVFSLLPTKECTCGSNHVCVGQNNKNNFVSRCINGQRCKENTCKNGGTCVETSSTTKCYCLTGFQGEDCSQSGGDAQYSLNFTVTPTDRTLKKGQSHTEECAVEIPSGEEVQYEWTFNEEKIQAYSRKTGFGIFPSGVLQIDEITDKTEGKYSCIATTSYGIAKSKFEYRIVESCDVKIYPGPESQSKKINENVLLTCHVGSQAIEVRWKKDGIYIEYNKNPRFKKLVNNYLLIRDIALSDAGLYQCEAEDKNGCYSYKEGTLTVINVKPINTYCGVSIYDEDALAISRISQGNDARNNENPWHVTIRTRGRSSMHRAFCGGTLISKTYMVTAASCIEEFEKVLGVPFVPENVEFLLGTINCVLAGDETTRTFKSFIVHPNYGDQAPYDNDIALIELDSPVEYTDSIRPICLEPADYNDRVFLENSDSLSPVQGKVAGCGQTRSRGMPVAKLQEVYLPYVYRQECEQSLGRRKNMLTDRMFCAGSKISRTGDACGGDSGGGLVMATSNRWVLTGIVSWGIGCDVDKYYGVYTDVGKYYDWIEGVTKFREEEVPYF